MDQRQNDPAFGRDENGRGQSRNQRSRESGREFQPGNYGFEERQYRGGQQGEGQYGHGGGSGGSSYGAGGYEPYSGESERFGHRDRWDERRDYYGQGQGQRWDESRGSSGSGYSQGYSEPRRWGERGWSDRDRWGDRDRFDEQRWRPADRWSEPQRDYYGQTQRGGSFFGDNRTERPGEREGFFRRIFKRGPKGYQRTDERLREDISERLMYATHIDSSEVTVAVTGGKVTLEGTVPERHMKHAIEDLVDECPGIQDIDNRVRVQSQREDFTQETGTGAASSRQTVKGESASSSGRKL
jgi:hypothetical protein